ncbi:MAG: endolytic transglycosylase MltG [Halothece sp.]
MTVSKVVKGLFYSLVSFGMVFSLLAGGTWYWWKSAIAPVDSSEEELITVDISQGTSAQRVGEILEEEGLIRSTLAWRIWLLSLRLQDQSEELKAGSYQLSASDSLPEMGKQVIEGKTLTTRFTIPEGWTQRQMAERFEELGYFSAEEFLTAVENFDRDQFPWLPDDLPHLEGFLYPDTYEISRDRATPDFIIELMLNRFAQVALPIYENQDSPYSLLEWVTLASIVEKETVVEEERSRIAAVFAKRLEEGMRLAADPTVEYGLNIRQTTEETLTLEQVNTPSPYNTYLNAGLPPTPIASPGKPALEDSLNPPETEYLFFVARYDGTHVFSKTFEEHQEAQRRIQN